jgi:hypothetical protein
MIADSDAAGDVPLILYKYYSASTALKVLETGRMRWSSPLLFNDLSELQRMPRLEPTIREASQLLPSILIDAAFGGPGLDESRLQPVSTALLAMFRGMRASGSTKAALIENLKHDLPNADEQLADALRGVISGSFLETARILCMTETYDNEAMWANYAQGHTGCVLGFRHLDDLHTPLLAARKVRYSDEVPIAGSGRDFLLYGDSSEFRKAALNAICYTKKAAWAYESEWRAMTWRPTEAGKQSGDYKFYDDELESVTLGPRTDPEDARSIGLLLDRYRRCSLQKLAICRGDSMRVLVKAAGLE